MDDDDDFVFKPAAVSPKSSTSLSEVPKAENFDNLKSNNVTSPNNINSTFSNSTTLSSAAIKTMRFPELDAFISEKKKEMDSELANLGKERLEEFLRREKEADKRREEEFLNASRPTSPKFDSRKTIKDSDYSKIDAEEEKILEEKRIKAKETWKELESEYEANLSQMHTEQSARLAQESQLQESLKAAGSVFDRELFDAIVDKCGKGRSSAFGKEKMSRFWEVLERSHPKNVSQKSPGASSESEDKLLASLLGINA